MQLQKLSQGNVLIYPQWWDSFRNDQKKEKKIEEWIIDVQRDYCLQDPVKYKYWFPVLCLQVTEGRVHRMETAVADEETRSWL